MSPRTALITGINGQDGSYLSDELLGRGYRVIGTTRSACPEAVDVGTGAAPAGARRVQWDVNDQYRLETLLREYRPDEVYNFAAYSSGAGMYDDPVGIGNVNGLAVARILEAIRNCDAGLRFCQPSGTEGFGRPVRPPQPAP